HLTATGMRSTAGVGHQDRRPSPSRRTATGTMTAIDLNYDPYDPILDLDPHPTWQRLREEAPLYYNERLDFFALSRYDDVLAALVDWETYSSARGTVLELIDPGAPAPHDEAIGMPMIFTDPQYHDVLRSLVSRAFTPRRVSAMEAHIRTLCAEGLAD